MDFLHQLGNRIKLLRQKNNLTQEELALKAGYTSRSSINKIEKGLVDIPQSKIIEIADILQTTPAYLMGWEENTTPEEPKLTEGEEMLLELFRKLPKEAQESYTERLREALRTLGLI